MYNLDLSYINIHISTRCRICNIHIEYKDILQVCYITTALYEYEIEVCNNCIDIEWSTYLTEEDTSNQQAFEDAIVITADTEEIV